VQHSDPDVLALVALGERAPIADAEHLLECAQCRADVAELRGVVTAVRVDVPVGAPVQPPAQVWEGIAAATGVRSAPRPERMADPSAPSGTSQPAAGDLPPAPDRGVDELALRRSRPGGSPGWRPLVAVAAAALVVGAVGGAVGSRLVDRTPTAPPTAQPSPSGGQQVIAQVSLDNLKPATGAAGSAAVVRTPSGQRLEIDVSRLEPVSGHFYEVWLIDRKIQKMVSLGILDGTTGEFVIPQGVDVGAYPIVDISVQQPGDPKHSGDSVLRGTIPT
jgi:hypothetical protein